MNTLQTILANLNAITNPHTFMAAALALSMGAAMVLGAFILVCLMIWLPIANRMGWMQPKDGQGTACTGLK